MDWKLDIESDALWISPEEGPREVVKKVIFHRPDEVQEVFIHDDQRAYQRNMLNPGEGDGLFLGSIFPGDFLIYLQQFFQSRDALLKDDPGSELAGRMMADFVVVGNSVRRASEMPSIDDKREEGFEDKKNTHVDDGTDIRLPDKGEAAIQINFEPVLRFYLRSGENANLYLAKFKSEERSYAVGNLIGSHLITEKKVEAEDLPEVLEYALKEREDVPNEDIRIVADVGDAEYRLTLEDLSKLKDQRPSRSEGSERIDEVEADIKLFSHSVYFNGDLAKFLRLDHIDDRGLKVYSFWAEFDEEKLSYDVREYYMRDDGEWDMKLRGLREPIEALEILLARVEAYPEDGILESYYSKTVEVGVGELCRTLGKPLPGDQDQGDREETFEEEGKRYPWDREKMMELIDKGKMKALIEAGRQEEILIHEVGMRPNDDPFKVFVRGWDHSLRSQVELVLWDNGNVYLGVTGSEELRFNPAPVYTELKNFGFLI